MLKDVDALRLAGNHAEAMVRLLALLDERYGAAAIDSPASAARQIDLRIQVSNCLIQLGRYEFAKTYCEELLGSDALGRVQRLFTILHFAICCYRLGRHQVALMALDQVAGELAEPATPGRIAADLQFIRGNVFLAMGAPQAAIAHLETARALFEGLPNALESCRAGLVLGEALIDLERLAEAEAVVRAELDRAERGGFERQKAFALSHLCVVAFRRGDAAASESFALRSNAIARPIEHNALVFRNCFYLWEIAKQRGDVSATRLNERTLRRHLGRIETKLPEAETFRDFLGRGES